MEYSDDSLFKFGILPVRKNPRNKPLTFCLSLPISPYAEKSVELIVDWKKISFRFSGFGTALARIAVNREVHFGLRQISLYSYVL